MYKWPKNLSQLIQMESCPPTSLVPTVHKHVPSGRPVPHLLSYVRREEILNVVCYTLDARVID